MSLLVMEDDVPKMLVLIATIIGVTLIISHLFSTFRDASIASDAFKNGYEQVVDTNMVTLWIKSRKE